MSSIRLENVNVSYPVLQDHYKSICRALLRMVSGGTLYKAEMRIKEVHALKDIAFELRDGDRVGLVGHNGAGKSTLLRTIGGFIQPDRGDLVVQGKISSLFSVNGGLDIDQTGHDNIFRMGRLFGIHRKEMRAHVGEIEEFSELGHFLAMPVRAYSDGMKIRLGLAVATCLHPDILLLDETINAGDAHFLERAILRLQKLYERANIIVMASHSASIMQRLCNKAIWLDHGQVRQVGPVEEVLAAYAQARHVVQP
jgi:ABC-type polysaccharide/polyol phosphate transport system ATPase subunit